MDLRSKFLLVSTVLVVDIFFFLLVGQLRPEYFGYIVDFLPFDSNIETVAIILGGLVIAVITSLILVRMFLYELKEVLG
jgi:hypothetical protein